MHRQGDEHSDEDQPLLAQQTSSSAIHHPHHHDSDFHSSVINYFCVSHFLSAWNSRFFEFGSVLFLASIYPNSLMPVSVYALARALSAIMFSPTVGIWVDKSDRLAVVRSSIIGQRLAVAVSCGALLSLKLRGGTLTPMDHVLFAVIVLIAAIEKLSAIMNSVAVTRDWAVEITEHNEQRRRNLNAIIRRIDLSCKLLAPFLVASIDEISTAAAIITTASMTILSVVFEYVFIQRVYDLVPALQRPRSMKTSTDDEEDEAQSQVLGRIAEPHTSRFVSLRSFSSIFPWSAITTYVRHQAFLPSFAYAFLHLTVLSFSGRMIAYLLAEDYGAFNVGAARSISTIAELSATWIAPRITRKLGVVGCGVFSISWQTACLTGGVACFLFAGSMALNGLICGVVLSRIGLWGVDLSVTNIIQDKVADGSRGSFSTTEAMVQNIFELASYGTTIIFACPDQFKWPILATMVSQYLGCATFWIHLCKTKKQ